jgi:hypothetical protein
MTYPTLAIQTRGAWIRFTLPTQPGEGASYPSLLEIGTLRSAARAAHLEGIGTSEAPNVSVTLNNAGNKASDLIGLPLRAKAIIEQDGQTLFEGTISRIRYGVEMTLEITA